MWSPSCPQLTSTEAISIIGLPGDAIAVRGGQVILNGAAIDEPYVYPGSAPYEPTEAAPAENTWTIGPNELFVVGEHRSQSSDSRVFGPITAPVGGA